MKELLIILSLLFCISIGYTVSYEIPMSEKRSEISDYPNLFNDISDYIKHPTNY